MKKYLYSISYYVTNERAEIAGLQNMNFYSNKNTIDAIYQDALKEISALQIQALFNRVCQGGDVDAETADYCQCNNQKFPQLIPTQNNFLLKNGFKIYQLKRCESDDSAFTNNILHFDIVLICRKACLQQAIVGYTHGHRLLGPGQKPVIIACSHAHATAIPAKGHPRHQNQVRLPRLNELQGRAHSADAVAVQVKVLQIF